MSTDGILMSLRPRRSSRCSAALAAKGPGGWWRIAKNLTRYGLGFGQEHPATPEFWQTALRDAEFSAVLFQPVVAEAGIVRGIRPAVKLPAISGLLRGAHITRCARSLQLTQ